MTVPKQRSGRAGGVWTADTAPVEVVSDGTGRIQARPKNAILVPGERARARIHIQLTETPSLSSEAQYAGPGPY